MIVKPDQMSQGKGIFITNHLEKIDLKELSVVQEYLTEPYLIDGLKFDLRLYVLVVSCDPLRIYIHKEGLVRFATQPYSKIDVCSEKMLLRNLFMHLTNYAVNKENPEFKQATSVEDGHSHKRTMTQLVRRLKAEGKDTELMYEQINEIVIKTMISCQ